MHLYKEKADEVVSKELYPNGVLHLYIVLKDGKPVNGCSSKKYYLNAALQEVENYSKGLLLKKISYHVGGKHKMTHPNNLADNDS